MNDDFEFPLDIPFVDAATELACRIVADDRISDYLMREAGPDDWSLQTKLADIVCPPADGRFEGAAMIVTAVFAMADWSAVRRTIEQIKETS